ncbi:alkylglycerol monooxygenase-like isoform X3 [Linepithema humile]|uniref:alkylglycerol monooxygenase-like isoform X3 n=1 Tax=Linepithema humile TaxID=83485 RepID=UPI00351EBEF8
MFDYFFKHIGKLWYLVSPKETIFEFPHEVPDYQQQIWMPFFLLLILEQIILRKKKFRLNDQVTSLSHWILHETVRVFVKVETKFIQCEKYLLFDYFSTYFNTYIHKYNNKIKSTKYEKDNFRLNQYEVIKIFSRGAEYYIYIIIHERFSKGWNLPWDSLWTWYITFIVVDFCYYWAHRSNHEIHFLWACHQVHHSSEEFNLAVGLRQHILQHWCNFAVYLPLAIFIPPSHFMVHNQFNLIYQLWIHTTLIGDLGPLELILNTPKHHRVHHGCNLFCLDKNYGGVFIIWDRLFGTFQEEQQKEEIIYGLVVNPNSFNLIYQQIFYLKSVIQKSISMVTWSDKFAVFWKGPSWFPGGPRLGLDTLKIKVKPRIIYDPFIPRWQKIYIGIQFLTVFFSHYQLHNLLHENLYDYWIIFATVNNLITLISISLLFDKCRLIYPSIIELVRCIVYLCFVPATNHDNLIDYCTYCIQGFNLIFVWLPYFINKFFTYIYMYIRNI